jgi:hypothetical protein
MKRIVAALVLALVTAGCTSSTAGRPTAQTTHPSTATSPTTISAPVTAPVGSTSSTPPVSASPSTGSGGVPTCSDASFDVSAANQEGATGHSRIVLLFRNRSTQPCTVHGYPGVDAVTSSGAILAHATRTLNGFGGGAHTVATLTVAPGATVSAVLEWLNFNPATSGSCATSAAIDVTPANTAHTVRLPVQVTVCSLQVHPTVAGSTGNG